ncbi:hypothetical protein BDK51DRAFT_53264 [Blyttiomyces helicus]|uniref:Uncharacterized protein n=1 Tax=Blyttiomyces helicus TaxID=388810 RepID=A0A4P9WL41_9FUNG|nr:hypothetical protein BDK51DRAFT_53264 [Blyttiomyces helicus]|eukprot:RKO93741.1 hypothetical protein BDK51DRAFT_53264 [Blyttiomyces helicus]
MRSEGMEEQDVLELGPGKRPLTAVTTSHDHTAAESIPANGTKLSECLLVLCVVPSQQLHSDLRATPLVQTLDICVSETTASKANNQHGPIGNINPSYGAKFNVAETPLALGGFDSELVPGQDVKNLMYMFDVGFFYFALDKIVMEVGDNRLVVEVAKEGVEDATESSWRVGKTDRHVEAEERGPIFLGYGVEPVMVKAKPKLAFLLFGDGDGYAPFRLGLDAALGEVVVNMPIELVKFDFGEWTGSVELQGDLVVQRSVKEHVLAAIKR